MAKEGESYLDELLNTVAPDWEEASMTPEGMLEDFDEDLEEEVSLEDALAILDDLPDSEEEYEDNEEWDGMNELLGIPSDFEDDEMPDFGEIPEMEEAPKKEKASKVDETPKEEERMPDLDEMVTSERDVRPEETADEDIPLDVDAIMPEEDMPETDMPVLDEESPEEEPKFDSKSDTSSDSVDVDDIFQDALSAVGYSGSDEEDDEDFLSVGEMDGFADAEGNSTVPAADPVEKKDAAAKKEKKGPGFFARIFGNIITDQIAEEEEKERQEEQAAKEKKAAQKEEKKKQAEISKEEKAQQAQEAKERKKQLKAEKAAKKAEEKEEKKRLKEERKAAEEAEQEVVGKINPIGAVIVVIFFATIGIFTVFGTMLFNRNMSLNYAENYFASGEYMKAYDAINMVDVDEENDTLYKRIRMCAQMQKEVDSYTNYTSIGMRLEALDSLVKGVNYYDLNKEEAARIGIINQVERLESQISASLNDDFGISQDEARELLAISDQSEYTRRLQELVDQMPAA